MTKTDQLLQGVAQRQERQSSNATDAEANNTIAGSMKGYLKRLGLLDPRLRRQKFETEMRILSAYS